MAKKHFVVYVIRQNGDKTFWDKVGVAFPNRDGSVNLELYLFPGVKFQLREPKNGDS